VATPDKIKYLVRERFKFIEKVFVVGAIVAGL